MASSARQLAERYETFIKRMDEKAALDGPEVEEILRGTPELLAALVEGCAWGAGAQRLRDCAQEKKPRRSGAFWLPREITRPGYWKLACL